MSGWGLPRVVSSNRTKQLTKFATLNVGSLTGRSGELADTLRRRRIDVCSVQETRWSGDKSRDIGCGYKVIYNGSAKKRNGVGIVVSERFRDAVAEVHRYNDRLMKVVLVAEGRRLHVFSAYAPQSGCTDQDKDEFWTLLDEKTSETSAEDVLVIAGDLNGHVGQTSNGNNCHGGHGFGACNIDGERILEFANTHDLAITNTFFSKRVSHLATYYSGNAMSQIDFVLVRKRDLKLVQDAKVVPSETTTTQHRPLICTMSVEPPKPRRPDPSGPARIKWWRFKEAENEMVGRLSLPPVNSVQQAWSEVKASVTAAARDVLGTTKPGRKKIDKLPWLWTEDVRQAVREKKRTFTAHRAARTVDSWQAYRLARSEAKKAVAAAKDAHFKELYDKLDTRDGERCIYRLAKQRHRKTEDIEKFCGINDHNGNLLSNTFQVTERWRTYFQEISTKEFPHPPIPDSAPVAGPVRSIDKSEVADALQKMRPGKATGPDDMAVEVWRSKLESPGFQQPAAWLAEFFNQIIKEKEIPADWRSSITVPIWKKKGNPADCNNYRPIRLLSHTMKVFERIIDNRIREIVRLSVNQTGFVKNCSTTDAIHAARLLFEKHREKKIHLHAAFLDLEKAFDRVPHDLIWFALRQHGVPEELVDWVKLLYTDTRSRVQAVAGTSRAFSITAGVHQGSALSPLLFVLVMDTVTRDLQKPAPWTLLYADDVMLASQNKNDLELQVQAWSDRLGTFGLRLNTAKTEYMCTDPDETGSLRVDGIVLPRTSKFKYLGSTIAADGDPGCDATTRVCAAWQKWRSLTGVICDRKITDRLKSKIYRTVIRPVALYAAECRPDTRKTECRFSVMETKMLRWASGLTRLDRVRNDDIRQRYGVAPIGDKLREVRLRWYGHVLRASDESVAQKGLQLTVAGTRPSGRPKQRWSDTLHGDLRIAKAHPDQAHDRAKWRRLITTADPATRDTR